MTDITRYDINEHGELPLTHGRYCRWEDVEDLLIELYKKIDNLEDQLAEAESPCCNWEVGFEDGKIEGMRIGLQDGFDRVIEIINLNRKGL